MRAKKMTEKQFNEAKEKIQSYFEEIYAVLIDKISNTSTATNKKLST